MSETIHETPLTGKTKSGHILSRKEELFCNLFVRTFKKVDSIIEAYDVDKTKKGWFNTARQMAYENLTKPYINERIRELLDKHHLNDEEVDLEVASVIRQNAEFSSKTRAINEYNKVTGRHATEKHEHTFKGASDEELRERAAELITGVVGDKRGVGKKKPGKSS